MEDLPDLESSARNHRPWNAGIPRNPRNSTKREHHTLQCDGLQPLLVSFCYRVNFAPRTPPQMARCTRSGGILFTLSLEGPAIFVSFSARKRGRNNDRVIR